MVEPGGESQGHQPDRGIGPGGQNTTNSVDNWMEFV
jgi:hypothetical protein